MIRASFIAAVVGSIGCGGKGDGPGPQSPPGPQPSVCVDIDAAARLWAHESHEGCVADIIADPVRLQRFAMAAFRQAPDKAYPLVAEGTWHVSEKKVLKAYASYGLANGDLAAAKRYTENAGTADDVVVSYIDALGEDRADDIFNAASGVDLTRYDPETSFVRQVAIAKASSTTRSINPRRLLELCRQMLDADLALEAYNCVRNSAARVEQRDDLADIAARALSRMSTTTIEQVRSLEEVGIDLRRRIGTGTRCRDARFRFNSKPFKADGDPEPDHLDLDLLLSLAGSAPVVVDAKGLHPSDEAKCYFQVAALECIQLLADYKACPRIDALVKFAGVLDGRELADYRDAVFYGKSQARIKDNRPAAFALHVALANILPEVGPGAHNAKFQQGEAARYWKLLHPDEPFVPENFFRISKTPP